MINANADAMGIIFPNNYDKFVPELVSERLMASICKPLSNDRFFVIQYGWLRN